MQLSGSVPGQEVLGRLTIAFNTFFMVVDDVGGWWGGSRMEDLELASMAA